MSSIVINGASSLGNGLSQLLMCEDIVPGATPSYQMCKCVYEYHPLGAKLAEKPIALAQSQPRDILIPGAPDMVKERFKKKWAEVDPDGYIFNLMALSRVYGIASLALLVDGQPSDAPLNPKLLRKKQIGFNVFDPLNTAGSLVLSQVANRLDFMKPTGRITVNGESFHPSRTCVVMNENPIYISYTVSAFGFVGRSVYQRILFPLKSFVQSMVTDDLVTLKAGTLIAKLKQAGSLTDAIQAIAQALKRAVIKQAQTYKVINITPEEGIESLNLQNIDGAHDSARKHVLENIAAGADDMPAILLNQESFAQGFGEGSEDARMVARYVDRIRRKMNPAYAFFDIVVRYLAWDEEFYKTVQKQFPTEYGNVDYDTAFTEWTNAFEAVWPSFLEEEPSEQVQVDEVKLKAAIAAVQVALPAMDPENKVRIFEWLQEVLNELQLLFGAKLDLDFDALENYEPEVALEEPGAGHPFSAQDSATNDSKVASALASLDDAVHSLREHRARKRVRFQQVKAA